MRRVRVCALCVFYVRRVRLCDMCACVRLCAGCFAQRYARKLVMAPTDVEYFNALWAGVPTQVWVVFSLPCNPGAACFWH